MSGVKVSQYYSASLHIRRTVSTPYKTQGKSYSIDATYISIPDTAWAYPCQSGWSLPFMFSLPGRHPIRIFHNPLGTGDVITDVIIHKFWKEKQMSVERKIPFHALITSPFLRGIPRGNGALRFRNFSSLEPFCVFTFHPALVFLPFVRLCLWALFLPVGIQDPMDQGQPLFLGNCLVRAEYCVWVCGIVMQWCVY